MAMATVSLSLNEIFIQNRAQLRRIARGIVHSDEVADDVVQDAFMRLAYGNAVRQPERPFCYCCQVVRNLALDHCRRQKLWMGMCDVDAEVEMVDTEDACTPEKSACDSQVLHAIDRALSGIPARARHVFELYRLEGLTQREIASRMGCALGTVNGLIGEAVKAIEQCRGMLVPG